MPDLFSIMAGLSAGLAVVALSRALRLLVLRR